MTKHYRIHFIIVALAIFLFGLLVFYTKSPEESSVPTQGRFLPELEPNLDMIDIIEVTQGKETKRIERQNDSWVLATSYHYPANFLTVRNIAAGLASLEVIEKKTDDAARLPTLALALPESEKGAGTRIRLLAKNADGASEPTVLTDIILGSPRRTGSLETAPAFYIRNTDETQAWLAKGTLALPQHFEGWFELSVNNITPSRATRLTIKPESGSRFTLAQDKERGKDFVLLEAKKNQKTDPVTLQLVVNAGLKPTITEIKPLAEISFKNSRTLTYEIEDELIYTLELTKKDNDYWLRVKDAVAISPDGKPASEVRVKEAEKLLQTNRNWAYKIDERSGKLISRSKESLIK